MNGLWSFMKDSGKHKKEPSIDGPGTFSKKIEGPFCSEIIIKGRVRLGIEDAVNSKDEK